MTPALECEMKHVVGDAGCLANSYFLSLCGLALNLCAYVYTYVQMCLPLCVSVHPCRHACTHAHAHARTKARMRTYVRGSHQTFSLSFFTSLLKTESLTESGTCCFSRTGCLASHRILLGSAFPSPHQPFPTPTNQTNKYASQ